MRTSKYILLTKKFIQITENKRRYRTWWTWTKQFELRKIFYLNILLKRAEIRHLSSHSVSSHDKHLSSYLKSLLSQGKPLSSHFKTPSFHRKPLSLHHKTLSSHSKSHRKPTSSHGFPYCSSVTLTTQSLCTFLRKISLNEEIIHSITCIII